MKRKLKINFSDHQYKAGTTVTVVCSDDGVPLDSFLRRRLRDAKIDNCVEWVEKVPSKIKPVKEVLK